MNGIYLVSVAFLNFKKFQSLKFVANNSLAMQIFLSVLESSIALVLRNCASKTFGKEFNKYSIVIIQEMRIIKSSNSNPHKEPGQSPG